MMAQIIAQTGATDANICPLCPKGQYFWSRVLNWHPGTIGGGLRMNAGAYGSGLKT